MQQIVVLEIEQGKVYVLPYDHVSDDKESIEEALLDGGFSLDRIEWMVFDGDIHVGWPR